MLSVLVVSCNKRKAGSSCFFIVDFEHFQYNKSVIMLITLGSVSQAYLGPYQTSAVEIFCKDCRHLLT